MARLFDDAASQYLEHAAAVVAAPPFTMACWFNTDDATVYQCLMAIGASGDGTNRHNLVALTNSEGRYLRMQTQAGASNSMANTTTTYTVGVWAHACGIVSAANARNVRCNGGGLGTDATNAAPTGVNVTRIGIRAAGGLPMSGHIAFPCIWNAALTGDEVASLAYGLWPGLVPPESIVALWPLRGDATEIDIVGGYGLTVSGATVSDNPRIFMPPRRRISYSIPATVGVVSIFDSKIFRPVLVR